MSGDALSLEGVGVRYRDADRDALSGCSFRVREAEKVALVGLNGSGKTTLLRACAGLVAFEGRIEVSGIAVDRRNLAAVRRRMGFLFSVPDDQILMPRVLDDVAIALAGEPMSPDERASRALATLERLGEADLAGRSSYELSHGQKQIVALAGAIVGGPPLLLMDEPSAGLDPPARIRLASILRSLPSAMVLATHDLTFARRCCDRWLLLEAGRLAQSTADPDDIVAGWEKG